jgi:chromosome segregation ATPase
VSSTLERQVLEAREELVRVRARLAEMEANVAALEAQYAAASREERSEFNALCAAQDETRRLVRSCIDACPHAARADLLALLAARAQDGPLQLSALRDDVAASEQELTKLQDAGRTQRALTLQRLRDAVRDARAGKAEADGRIEEARRLAEELAQAVRHAHATFCEQAIALFLHS